MRRKRLHIVDTAEGLDAEIDARPSRFAAAALTTWLAVWLAGEWTIVARLGAYPDHASDPYLTVLLVAWTLVGLVGLRRALRHLRRRELLRLDGARLRYRWEYRWFRRERQFERSRIRSVRTVPGDERDALGNPRIDFWGTDTCGVILDCGDAAFRLAAPLDRVESEQLAGRIAGALARLDAAGPDAAEGGA